MFESVSTVCSQRRPVLVVEEESLQYKFIFIGQNLLKRLPVDVNLKKNNKTQKAHLEVDFFWVGFLGGFFMANPALKYSANLKPYSKWF
jgi:hypothetical protein